MPATYEPIASSAPSSASSVVFSSIPDTYTDLVVVYTLTSTTNGNDVFARFNSDSSAVYSATFLSGSGSAASSIRTTAQTKAWLETMAYMSGDGRIATGVFHVMSYANTNVFKTVLSGAGTAAGGVDRVVSLWRSTSAITSLEILPAAGTFSGAIALYGIKAA